MLIFRKISASFKAHKANWQTIANLIVYSLIILHSSSKEMHTKKHTHTTVSLFFFSFFRCLAGNLNNSFTGTSVLLQVNE